MNSPTVYIEHASSTALHCNALQSISLDTQTLIFKCGQVNVLRGERSRPGTLTQSSVLYAPRSPTTRNLYLSGGRLTPMTIISTPPVVFINPPPHSSCIDAPIGRLRLDCLDELLGSEDLAANIDQCLGKLPKDLDKYAAPNTSCMFPWARSGTDPVLVHGKGLGANIRVQSGSYEAGRMRCSLLRHAIFINRLEMILMHNTLFS